MGNEQEDRRVQRSRQILQQALGSLITEKRFDKITVQDIIDRANVGRTTFYAHFQNKEDLFLSGHEGIIGMICDALMPSADNQIAEPSPELIEFIDGVRYSSRDAYFNLTWGNSTGEVLRLLRERTANQLEARLHDRFNETDSSIPFQILAQHLAASTVSLMSWWLEKRTPYSAREIAAMLHQMNQAVIRTALSKVLN